MKIGAAFPSSYLKADDLQGRKPFVTIDNVRMEDIGGEHKPILMFAGKDKGMVLNKTNAGRLIDLTGSDDTDDWRGWTVQLEVVKVDFQGKRVPAIRINDDARTAKKPEQSAPPPPPDVAPITDDDIPF